MSGLIITITIIF